MYSVIHYMLLRVEINLCIQVNNVNMYICMYDIIHIKYHTFPVYKFIIIEQVNYSNKCNFKVLIFILFIVILLDIITVIINFVHIENYLIHVNKNKQKLKLSNLSKSLRLLTFRELRVR